MPTARGPKRAHEGLRGPPQDCPARMSPGQPQAPRQPKRSPRGLVERCAPVLLPLLPPRMLDWGGGRFAAAAPVELCSFGAKSLRRTRNQEQEEEGEEEEEEGGGCMF